MEEHESRDEERTEEAERAPEIPFEDVEQMVDEALALPPAGEFKIPVSSFFQNICKDPRSNRKLRRRVSHPDGWMLWI